MNIDSIKEWHCHQITSLPGKGMELYLALKLVNRLDCSVGPDQKHDQSENGARKTSSKIDTEFSRGYGHSRATAWIPGVTVAIIRDGEETVKKVAD
ncbi:MAG: hypothetical protein ACLU9S_05820 [Oscillospiraceae bacterium]